MARWPPPFGKVVPTFALCGLLLRRWPLGGWFHGTPGESALPVVLHHWNQAAPCLRHTLDRTFQLSERKSKAVLKFLKDNWLLPIGGHKHNPKGNWIIVTEAEFIDYERQARRTAVSALATLYKMRRANFPRLAGQLALGFVKQVKQEIEEEVLH